MAAVTSRENALLESVPESLTVLVRIGLNSLKLTKKITASSETVPCNNL